MLNPHHDPFSTFKTVVTVPSLNDIFDKSKWRERQARLDALAKEMSVALDRKMFELMGLPSELLGQPNTPKNRPSFVERARAALSEVMSRIGDAIHDRLCGKDHGYW